MIQQPKKENSEDKKTRPKKTENVEGGENKNDTTTKKRKFWR